MVMPMAKSVGAREHWGHQINKLTALYIGKVYNKFILVEWAFNLLVLNIPLHAVAM
jgi:hypothetical protein